MYNLNSLNYNMPSETVKVVVRCRPFNKREKETNCR